MKSPYDWIAQERDDPESDYMLAGAPQIRRIQLDAWKRGMTDAARIVYDSKLLPDGSVRIFVSDEVLNARDIKTETDLL